jgi:serine/threonine-protein kinase HipA
MMMMMAKTLDVYLHDKLVGHLIQDDYGEMLFEYSSSWLEDSHAIPLSQSLPLRKEQFKRKECRGFFAGVLPEEAKREIVARNLGISDRNDFAMLEQIGGECAGAVTFIHKGEPYPEHAYSYRSLMDHELANILRELPQRPLMAGEVDIRLSLAGVQDKIAVHVAEDKISIPLNGAPSTHILKPAIERFEGVVFNEALCMNLAAEIDLPVASIETRRVEDIDYILVERYDRKVRKSSIERLHQEDFCQALAITPEMKYQSEGGPSLGQCFNLIREVSSTPVIDLQHFLHAVIFNYLVGNNDAHGKNFSFVYDEANTARLAPLYDIVCTVYYPQLSKKMAMKIGDEYRGDLILMINFERMAEEAGLAKPLVKERVSTMADEILKGLGNIDRDHSVAAGVAELIEVRSQNWVDKVER